MRAFEIVEYDGDFEGLKKCLKELLPRTKIVHLIGVKEPVEGLREFYEKLSDALGTVADVDEDASTGGTTGNRWVDIRFDPQKQQYYRHSNTAQPFHNDAAYVPSPPEIAFFYCEKPARAGGASTFLDAVDLIHYLSHYEPDLLEKLETVELTFEKGDRARRKPVITYDEKGPLLNWIETRLKERDEFTDDFKDCLNRLRFLCSRWIPLNQGEAVFFHDERVFHGRASFLADEEGDRLLWKGGIRL
jgi:alpha-ketoglutarate-dependent taurine dioxygenase